MAWKLENMRKDPNSKESYADLFISQIKEEPKTACLFTIGDARTVEIILEKYKNTQFVVFDYPALIKFLDFAKPANLFKAIPLKYDWESESEFLEFIGVEMQKVSIEGANMSFDLIIANPPYGKSSSLSKKIVNKMLENKIAEEYIVLAPPKTFYGVLDRSKELKCVSSYLNRTCVFEDAAVETLFLDHIVLEKQNKYKEPSDFLLDEKHKVFRNAVIEYNKTHSNNVKLFGGNGVQKYEKSKYLGFEDSLLFEVPIYTPSPLNGVARQGESYEHNVLKNAIDWDSREKGRGPGLLYFANQVEYNNFSNWWYSAKRRREGGLINFMFDILFILYGGDPSLLKYVEVIPNVDWSHPWTDAEILKEIGLPEDFLEKEEC